MTAISPFEHTPLVPSETVTATPLLTLSAMAAGFYAAEAYGFRSRDLA